MDSLHTTNTTHHQENMWDERHPFELLNLCQYQCGVWSACWRWLVERHRLPQADLSAAHSQRSANFVHMTIISGTQTLGLWWRLPRGGLAMGHPAGHSEASSLGRHSFALTRDLHNRSAQQRPSPRLPWVAASHENALLGVPASANKTSYPLPSSKK